MTDPRLIQDPDADASAPCPCRGCPGSAGEGAAHGWHTRKGPAPLLHSLHGTEDTVDFGGRPSRWVDHAYRLRLPDGRWCYVAEPYELNDLAFADLAYLTEHGYDVTVTAWQARHCPSRTLAVHIVPNTEDRSDDLR